ncbi:hypothetical protein [Runella zeae]|uniref:hypothetical protein n=1 Tax=Runella zeae TaxID=94255 RepID=UPI00048A698C|nr:hypothetical protein [Runella zeae]
MTELQLFKFVQNHQLEYNYIVSPEGEQQDNVVLFVDFLALQDFTKLLGNYLQDYDQEITLKEDYIAVDMRYICDYFNISLTEVFERK